MLTDPHFEEVPAPKRRDIQYRIYFIVLLSFAALALLESSWLVSVLLVIPAAAVGLVLWLRHRANPWSGKGAPPYPDRKYYSRIRLGWSRESNPQYAARGATLVPFGPFGGGAIRDSYAGAPFAFAAMLLLLPLALPGMAIAVILRLKRRFSRPLLTSLLP